jgi:hypothetical protein
MPGVLGVECEATIGGTAVAAIVSSSSPAFMYNTRALISSGPPVSGADQALMGYAPSSTAGSGFNLTCQCPITGAAGLINAALTPAGVAVAMGFGAAGGVSVAGCIATSVAVSGAEGGDITIAMAFVSKSLPVIGSGAAPTAKPFFIFNDVTSATGVGGAHSDLTSFTWRVTRNVARYTGNSPYGLPQKLKISRTECSLDLEYEKDDDTEGTAQVAQPITPADASVALAQAPFISPGGAALTLTCHAAFGDAYPVASGDFETFVSERMTYKSSTGTYTVA